MHTYHTSINNTLSLWPLQASSSSRPVPKTTSTWRRFLTAWWTPSARRWTRVPTETPLHQLKTRDPTWARRPTPASVAAHASWQHTPMHAHARTRRLCGDKNVPYHMFLQYYHGCLASIYFTGSFPNFCHNLKDFYTEMPKSWERTSVPSAPNLCFTFKCVTINLLPLWARSRVPFYRLGW